MSVRERGREERRRQILDATAKIVGEKGFFGFGIQELATRCGLTKAGLLHHFGTKDDLLLQLLRDRDTDDEQAVTAALGYSGNDKSKTPSLGMVETAFLTIVEQNLKRPEFVRLFAVVRLEALNPAHPAHQHMADRDAHALRQFEQMLAPHTSQPLSFARQVQATIHGLEVQWMQSGSAFDMLCEWEVQLGRILDGISRSEAEGLCQVKRTAW